MESNGEQSRGTIHDVQEEIRGEDRLRPPPNSPVAHQISFGAGENRGNKQRRADDMDVDGMYLENLNKDISSALIRLAEEVRMILIL